MLILFHLQGKLAGGSQRDRAEFQGRLRAAGGRRGTATGATAAAAAALHPADQRCVAPCRPPRPTLRRATSTARCCPSCFSRGWSSHRTPLASPTRSCVPQASPAWAGVGVAGWREARSGAAAVVRHASCEVHICAHSRGACLARFGPMPCCACLHHAKNSPTRCVSPLPRSMQKRVPCKRCSASRAAQSSRRLTGCSRGLLRRRRRLLRQHLCRSSPQGTARQAAWQTARPPQIRRRATAVAQRSRQTQHLSQSQRQASRTRRRCHWLCITLLRWTLTADGVAGLADALAPAHRMRATVCDRASVRPPCRDCTPPCCEPVLVPHPSAA